MKAFFCIFVSLFLASCGSKNDTLEVIDALKATSTPTTQSAIINTPTPTPKIMRNIYDDYKKIQNGMTREEIISILGNYHDRSEKTFCDNGKCKTYEYLSWYYSDEKIGVTIMNGVATYTYTL